MTGMHPNARQSWGDDVLAPPSPLEPELERNRNELNVHWYTRKQFTSGLGKAHMQLARTPALSFERSFHSVAQEDSTPQVRLAIDPAEFSHRYNREPFEFKQALHTLDLFQFPSLCRLCDLYSSSNRGFFIAAGAPTAGTDFYAVPHGGLKPSEAVEQLDARPLRILLKRPESQDEQFKDLLHQLFRQVAGLPGGPGGERIVRLESAILISSASTITPLHFDPEVGFFSQIEGEKIYHVYSPADTSEAELERFYIRGVVDIAVLKIGARNPAQEHVFHLRPGKGFHQPQNSPHWVETGGSRSISYTFVFETESSRALGRMRAFNHYERKLGFSPARPGTHPERDAIKATMMRAAIPIRKAVGQAVHRLRGTA